MLEMLLVALPFVGALINGAFGLYALRLRSLPVARTFGIAMLLAAVYGLGYALEVASPGLSAKLTWMIVRCPVLFAVPVWFVMSLHFTGRAGGLRAWHLALLCVLPASTAVLQAIPATLPLVRQDLHLTYLFGTPLLAWKPGPVFLLHILQGQVLVFIASCFLQGAYRRARGIVRVQTALVAASSWLILGAGVASQFVSRAQIGYDFTPMVLLVSGAMTGIALFRYGMFSIVPIAQRLVVENMPSLVFVLDTEHRIVSVNKAAQKMVGGQASALLGQTTREALRNWSDIVDQYYDVEAGGGTVTLGEGEQERTYDLTISSLSDSRGRLLGRLAVMHDVTDLKRAKEAAEAALSQSRTLSGLLPICACCKSIRDDQGYWRAVEQYVAEHADVEFSHGYCPECVVRVRAEFQTELAAMRTGVAKPMRDANPMGDSPSSTS